MQSISIERSWRKYLGPVIWHVTLTQIAHNRHPLFIGRDLSCLAVYFFMSRTLIIGFVPFQVKMLSSSHSEHQDNSHWPLALTVAAASDIPHALTQPAEWTLYTIGAAFQIYDKFTSVNSINPSRTSVEVDLRPTVSRAVLGVGSLFGTHDRIFKFSLRWQVLVFSCRESSLTRGRVCS
jgi:hypothetical protein